jgi:hypothetical protein
VKPPFGVEHCRRQALDNIILWYKLDSVNLPHIGPLGLVSHPRKQSLTSSLGFVRVLNETVFVVERYIKIKLRRLKYRKSRFLFRQSNRKPSRLTSRLIRIDTHTCRRRVGDGVVATKGRVLYDAGPLVDYNAIALEHIARYEAGEINSRGDPLPPTTAVDSTPSTPDSVLALLE